MGSKNKVQRTKNKKNNKDKPNSTLSTQDSSGNKNESGGGGGGSKFIKDARFASVHSDPRFQKVPKRKTKVVIDSRFNRMFNDKRFAPSSAPLDKRGKPKKGNSQNSLRHYYQLEDEEDGKEEEKRKKEALSEEGDSEAVDEESESEMSEKDSDEETEEEEEEGSESGSTTEEEDVDIIYEDGEPEIQEENIPMIEKETRRLAVVNMDWRHVKAADLYKMLSSFLRKDGQILSVAVYPSEFGLQRMKEEEIHGPIGLFDDEDEENNEDGDDVIDSEKLREYEKSRLRYYYAVVECDSSATADYLYKACDGVEFERSSNVLDLRFIPDSMEFKHPPRDVVTEAPANYEGLSFHTQALQQSKIHLTWDEDEPQCRKILKRKFNAEQLAELELKEFLASDESESDDDNENENEDTTEDQSNKKNKKRDKYLALLQSGDGSDGDGEDNGQDMEVTFNTGLEDISKRILEKKSKEAETVWEAYLRKRQEKKKAKRNKSKYSSEDESDETDIEATEEPDDFFVEEPSVKRIKKEGKQREEDKEKEAEASRAELELLLADDKGADTGVKGFNLKPKNSKGKKGKEVIDEEKIPTVDDDPRFAALFTSPLYALDPTDPQFKRSATYARQIAKKLQKGEQQELAVEDLKTKNAQFPSEDPGTNKVEHEKSDILPSKENHELSSMVRSVKMKLKQAQLPSDSKMSKKSVSGMGRKQKQHLVHSNKKSKVLGK